MFKERRGVELFEDDRLRVLMLAIRQGLEEVAVPATERREAREGPADFELAPTTTVRGAPALPQNLTRSLAALVEWLGPADAALAYVAYGFHCHPGSVVSRAQPEGTRDVVAYGPRGVVPVLDLIRRLEKRLDAIARTPTGRNS